MDRGVQRCRAAIFRPMASMRWWRSDRALAVPDRAACAAAGARLWHAGRARSSATRTSLDDLGPRFAGDLTGAEVRYLIEHEWAQTADDVLWRRSKLGLTATPEELVALDRCHCVGDCTGLRT